MIEASTRISKVCSPDRKLKFPLVIDPLEFSMTYSHSSGTNTLYFQHIYLLIRKDKSGTTSLDNTSGVW